MDQHAEHAQWVVLDTFRSVFDAQLAQQQLEAEGIPVLVKSEAAGVFGAGYSGAVTGGVTVLVPDVEMDRARDLLDLAP